MPSRLCLTFRFPGGTFHGRRDHGEPEWPPSPFRAFQALVRAAADTRALGDEHVRAAFEWLSQLPPPDVVAPRAVTGRPRRAAVPNNDGDVLAAAWAARREPAKDSSQLKTLKEFRPSYVPDERGVHYLWRLDDRERERCSAYLPALSTAASHIVALGWGIDLAVAELRLIAPDEEAGLIGERWSPSDDRSVGVPLRVPFNGILEQLGRRHDAFRNRVAGGIYTPPPSLVDLRTVQYRRAYDRPPLPVAAFSLLRPDASAYRPFNAARRALTVAGLMRGATRSAAEHAGWDREKIASFVLGHGPQHEQNEHVPTGTRRFAYLPLPSLEHRSAGRPPVVSSVRRVLVYGATYDTVDEVGWATRALSGRDLVDEHTGEVLALLSAIPQNDPIVRSYLGPAAEWTTVTPIVLPGFDDPRDYRRRIDDETDVAVRRRLLDKLHARVDGLLRKSLLQAGWPSALADAAELEWRASGFLPGVDLASRYGVPDHLRRYPRFHVRLRWRDASGAPIELPGPLCIGAGRFYGVGLFVAARAFNRPLPETREPETRRAAAAD